MTLQLPLLLLVAKSMSKPAIQMPITNRGAGRQAPATANDFQRLFHADPVCLFFSGSTKLMGMLVITR